VVGGRYEDHSTAGSSLVPRIALTKVFHAFHAKLLYSESFRAPAFEQFAGEDPTNPLRPERTRLGELEVGYQFTDHLFASANVFDMLVQNPIVYSLNPVTYVEAYQNTQQTGTRGAEATFQARYDWGYVNANYSFYTAGGTNQLLEFSVPGHAANLLGYAQHKFTASASVRVWRTLSINPSIIVLSGRWGWLTGDGMGNGILGQTDPGALANLFVQYKGLGVPGLDVGVGVYNLFDYGYAYIQAYAGAGGAVAAGHAPTPGPSRDYILRVTYSY